MGLSQKLHSRRIVLHTGATTLPAPALVTDGESTSALKQGGRAERGVAVAIDCDGGAVKLTDAFLCAYDADPVGAVPMWRKIVLLNNGADIDITPTLGWEEVFLDIAINDRLAIFATVSANTVDAYAKAVEVHE